MQQTEKYKFSIIDTSDTFSPDALNDNARAVETELARVEAESAAGDAAVRVGFAAGDAAVRAEFAAADANLAQTVAAVEKGANFFHLAGPVTIPSMTTYALDLSGVDMSQYRALLIFTQGADGSTVSKSGMLSVGDMSVTVRGGAFAWLYRRSTQNMLLVYSVSAGTAYPTYYAKASEWSAISSILCTNLFDIDVYGIKA